MIASRLAESGVLVTQATSPYLRQAFWCIVETLESVASTAQHVGRTTCTCPALRVGVAMLGPESIDTIEIRSDLDTKFISQDGLASMFHFPKDLARRPVELNRLTTAVVSDYYRSGWCSFH